MSFCWHCNAAYPIEAARCPHCKATNPNVDLGRANAELQDETLIGKDVWQVVEHAGCADEKVVHETNSFDHAETAMRELYTEGEIEELGVDLLKNGSTEW